MEKGLISIIVPAYNVEKYVEKTLRSIQNQMYKNIEIICVDDGSTDGTFDVIRKAAESDCRIKALHKENEGVSKARKFGFEHAAGEYIGFVDADDEIEPMMYERLYDNLTEYGADISHCAHDVRYPDGRVQKVYGTARIETQGNTGGLRSLLSGSFEPGLCNKMYKSSLLKNMFDSGKMDLSIKINEDLLMNYYLFKGAKKTVFEDLCLYHYLKREGSASNSGISRGLIWDQINVKKIILADSAGAKYEEDAKRAYLITCITKLNALIKQNSHEFDDDIKKITDLVKEQRNDFGLLNKKQKAGARLLISSPRLYSIVVRKFK